MDGKFFRKETRNKVADFIDDSINAGVLEVVDGQAARFALDFLGTQADKIVPDEADNHVNDAIDAAFENNFEKAGEEVGIALDIVVDVPLIDGDTEREVCVTAAKFLVLTVKSLIEKRKNQ